MLGYFPGDRLHAQFWIRIGPGKTAFADYAEILIRPRLAQTRAEASDLASRQTIKLPNSPRAKSHPIGKYPPME